MLTVNEIRELLPHRYPFLLVDRVEEVSEDKTFIRAIKNVTANEPQFTGHFPDVPVMPGVLMLEALAQTCCILEKLRMPEDQRNRKDMLFYFAGIDKVRFKRVVVPGDRLVFECKFLRGRMGMGWYSVTATVDGELAVSAEMTSACRPVKK